MAATPMAQPLDPARAVEGVGDGCDVVQNPVERIESCRR